MSKKKSSVPVAGAKITQAEWEVMQILWSANAPMPVADIVAVMEDLTTWKPKTIRSFLNRLVQKQAVEVVKLGSPGLERLHYIPLIDEPTARLAKQETFVNKFFGGTVQSMLAGCIQSGEISTEELLQLREMIDKQVKNQKGEKP